MRGHFLRFDLRRHALWAALGCLILFTAGCGGGGGGGVVDKEPPTVSVVNFTGLLPATGGTATIDVEAADDVGVVRVEVEITKPDNSSSLVTATKVGSIWRAQFDAPANSGTQAAVYKFVAYAYDAAGKVGVSDKQSFQVSAPDVPPPPPPFVTGK
ncbi:MAG: hypothetical protein QHI38_07255 [Armatimonadota bacterium]|nr:hypothetical protein [Armatimonadota bacterium]